jgi:hypothetical protein
MSNVHRARIHSFLSNPKTVVSGPAPTFRLTTMEIKRIEFASPATPIATNVQASLDAHSAGRHYSTGQSSRQMALTLQAWSMIPCLMPRVNAWKSAHPTQLITLPTIYVINVHHSAQSVARELPIAQNVTTTLLSTLLQIQLSPQLNKTVAVWIVVRWVSSRIRREFAKNVMKVVRCARR